MTLGEAGAIRSILQLVQSRLEEPGSGANGVGHSIVSSACLDPEVWNSLKETQNISMTD